MPKSFFKVWNASRTTKRCVVASTLADIVSSGSEKLGYESTDGVQVVFEEDGTVIDDDEVLLELQGKTLILLASGQEWSSSQLCDQPLLAPVVAAPMVAASLADHNSVVGETSSPVDCDDIEIPHDVANTSIDITKAIMKEPLPCFSSLVQQHIAGKDSVPERIWSLLISETAHYYFGKFPEIDDAQQYRAIGMKMFEKYPSIGLEGANPWSAFNKSLSQKIRHIRLSRKLKSHPPTADPVSKKPCFRAMSVQEADGEGSAEQAVTDEDIQRHVAEMGKEWDKSPSSRSVRHVRELMKATLCDRKRIIEQSSSSCMSEVFIRYPCFQDANNILYEYALQFGKQRLVKLGQNLTRLLTAAAEVSNLQHHDTEDPISYAAVISAMEKATRWHQGKGSIKTSSVLKIKSEVADGDVTSCLATVPLDAPSIVAFVDNGCLQALFVVGDTVHTELTGKSATLKGALAVLLCLYYIFDLAYPRPYSMMMALLQVFVAEEPYKAETSRCYKLYLKRLRAAFDKVAETASETTC